MSSYAPQAQRLNPKTGQPWTDDGEWFYTARLALASSLTQAGFSEDYTITPDLLLEYLKLRMTARLGEDIEKLKEAVRDLAPPSPSEVEYMRSRGLA